MFGRVFYIQKNEERTVNQMIYTSSRNEDIPFWRGGKFNRGHPRMHKSAANAFRKNKGNVQLPRLNK